MSSGNFPKDLRVLVYAEDLFYLQDYVTCLQSNRYKVTASSNEREVMFQLCERQHMFDIALMDVKKPDGYIFQLISKIDLPIIITSEDKSVASVTKWMTNGACDFLAKPLRYEDLELIYKNVVRAGYKSVMVTGEIVSGEEKSSDRSSASKSKKRRIVWDEYLCKKFYDAVNYLREKAVPKSILAHMEVPYLTRDHVASHLQKHRLREEKEKEKKKSTTPEEGQEANHEDVSINSIAQPNGNSGMLNDQQQGNHQTTSIISTQPRSDAEQSDAEFELIDNIGGFFSHEIATLLNTNVDCLLHGSS